jgi:hypothetical protein
VRGSLSFASWSRFALVGLLPGCLVSFNDYPLGDPNGGESTAGSVAAGGSGASAGDSAAGGKVMPTGGANTGGSDAMPGGGTSAMPEGGSSDPDNGGAAPFTVNLNLIDDFEDGNAAIVEQQGRSGTWYIVNDGKGMQTPRADELLTPSLLSPARSQSQHGAHTFGGPFQTWGALIGTSLASSSELGIPYDVGGHQGLKLWVRSGATSQYAAKQVRLNLPTPGTNTGGGCTVCSDHYGADVALTSKWTQVTVPFSSLKQVGWGRPHLVSPDLAHVTSIQFLFPANVSFDLWLDDIELY